MRKSLGLIVLLAALSLQAQAQSPAMPAMNPPAAPTTMGGAPNAPIPPPAAMPKMDAMKAAGAKAQQKALVNLNTASVDDLQKLPGIGPVKAKAIVDARPYKSVEDLKKVKGIKEDVIAKLRSMVTVK